MTSTLVLRDGIGYIQSGDTLVSATPADYVAEIEQLRRERDHFIAECNRACQETREALARETAATRRAAEPAAAPEIHEPFTISATQVERICTAYESGYDRGQSKHDISQPYAAGCPEARAYYQGWVRGVASTAPRRGAEHE